ncbi:MAG: 2-phospho-L-lactate guanylyltransferase [Acidobacteriota bacterium]
MTKAILIPIKEPARVKTRLANLLTLAERQQLVWAMFEDVCEAVAQTTGADRIFIVTSFAKAAARARSLGFEVLGEERQESESASIDWASQILRDRGFDAALRLPADIPLVEAADIDALLAVELTKPMVLMVPSFEETGTNAILRAPPNLFPSRFGTGSLALHQAEAARIDAQCLIVKNERIALDIDEPHDIKMFLAKGKATKSLRLLEAMQIAKRFIE